jgi:predicted dehydrogenase
MLLSRRNFLATSAAAGLSLTKAPSIRAAQKGRKYRTALIGCGWWGMNILHEAIKAGQSEVVALCDVDEGALEVSADELTGVIPETPRKYKDFRELLEHEQVEIAIVATPDHWHALPTIAAIEAGAHIYVEKPTGHTIGESQAMLAAARANDRVVQVGLHRRIGPHHVSAMEFLKGGGAGRVGMVRTFVHSSGGKESPTPNSSPPPGMDWDFYCGPAPMRPFNRRIHPGGFRNFLDFANGTLGDWGVHWLDQILWFTDEQAPKTVYSHGGRPIKGAAILNEEEQTTDAPDHQVAVYEFEDFTAEWEHRRFGGNGPEKHRVGAYFYGDKGTLHIGWRDGWSFYPSGKNDPSEHVDPQFDHEKDGHNVAMLWADFLDCIATGRRPAADIEIGHQATTMALLGMLSYKLGHSVQWDGQQEQIVGNPAANRLLRREYRGDWVYPSL